MGYLPLAASFARADEELASIQFQMKRQYFQEDFLPKELSLVQKLNMEVLKLKSELFTTGLHDSQVQYFEPAKWVARLRTLKTDRNVLLLKTNMKAGHGGSSGRFDYLQEIALNYVFLFALEGITE